MFEIDGTGHLSVPHLREAAIAGARPEFDKRRERMPPTWGNPCGCSRKKGKGRQAPAPCRRCVLQLRTAPPGCGRGDCAVPGAEKETPESFSTA
jgi:hypothetical protein